MLQVLSILPTDNSLNIPIDQKIRVAFDQPVDFFSIKNGISLYTISDGTWSGPDLGQLDTKYSDVLSVSDEYYNIQYTYAVSGNVIDITPIQSLFPDRKYYIAIFPGNDATRFVSTKTVSDPIYTRAASGTATIEATSSYIGTENGDYNILFTGANTFDLSFGLVYIDSFTYLDGQEINLGNLKIKTSGTFDVGDEVIISVFKASGVSSLYKTSFTTSKYTTVLPTSQRVDDATFTLDPDFFAITSIPENDSVNNLNCNPITIKFNKSIDTNQNILDKIVIKRTSLEDGRVKQIKYKYKINGNILKLYLISG